MLSSDGLVKLADFGASKRIECVLNASGSPLVKLPTFKDSLNQAAMQSLKGTPYWMAPEVLGGEPDGTKGDIWSVGCVAVEMLTGTPPFSDLKFNNAVVLMMHIAKPGSIPTMPPQLSVEGDSFLQQCFRRDAECVNRPTAEMLLLHPFTQELRKGADTEGTDAESSA